MEFLEKMNATISVLGAIGGLTQIAGGAKQCADSDIAGGITNIVLGTAKIATSLAPWVPRRDPTLIVGLSTTDALLGGVNASLLSVMANEATTKNDWTKVGLFAASAGIQAFNSISRIFHSSFRVAEQLAHYQLLVETIPRAPSYG